MKNSFGGKIDSKLTRIELSAISKRDSKTRTNESIDVRDS